MDNHNILTRNGCRLNKNKLSKTQENRIKRDLTVSPTVHPDYKAETDDESFSLYKDGGDHYIVPRYYANKHFGKPTADTTIAEKINMKFLGELRQNQQPIVDTCLPLILRDGGGIISVACAGGKTTMSLYIACMLGIKTLVLVHKTFLQDQWIERCTQFTNAKIGIIKQKKVDVKGKDIVIGMLQSISMIDYDPEIFKDFGLVICDECHHFGSRVFSQAFGKVAPKYTLGLSATPIRADGLTKVFLWHLGDFMYRAIRKADKNVVVKVFTYESTDKLFCEKKKYLMGKMKPCIPIMVTNLHKIPSRNTFCINIIDSLRKQHDRKTLVLSGRLDHLRILKEGIDALINKDVTNGLLDDGEITSGYYIGGMKEYQRNNAAKCDIIFATFEMAAEGLDIDSLNTLVLATPKKNIIQSIGRIMRKPIKEGSIKPLVIDIADDFSVFCNWTKVRLNYYSNQQYTVDHYRAKNDKCIDLYEYVKNKGIVKDTKNIDIRKTYLCYKEGADIYEAIKSEDFIDEPMEKFTYKANLDEIFNIQNDIEEMKGEDFIIQTEPLNLM